MTGPHEAASARPMQSARGQAFARPARTCLAAQSRVGSITRRLMVGVTVLCFPAAMACEPVESGVEFLGGYLGWNGLMLEMSTEQIEERVGLALDFEPYDNISSGDCSGVGAVTAYRDSSLFLAFRGDSSDRRLALIFVRRPGPCRLRDTVDELKTAVPNLVYRPPRHDPLVSESENRKPLYLVAQDSDQGVLVDSTQGIWITYASCLD